MAIALEKRRPCGPLDMRLRYMKAIPSIPWASGPQRKCIQPENLEPITETVVCSENYFSVLKIVFLQSENLSYPVYCIRVIHPACWDQRVSPSQDQDHDTRVTDLSSGLALCKLMLHLKIRRALSRTDGMTLVQYLLPSNLTPQGSDGTVQKQRTLHLS